MIDYVNGHYDDIDTLIVGRGGGSADDLWAFNEEAVARSIYRSRIPVISAVGHEIDFTISDLVADMRAETPTAAAQMAVPDSRELSRQLSDMAGQLRLQLSNKLMYYQLVAEREAESMKRQLSARIDQFASVIERHRLILEENNPSKVLESGYAVLSGADGRVITEASALTVGESYDLTLRDGHAACVITEIGSEKDA